MKSTLGLDRRPCTSLAGERKYPRLLNEFDCCTSVIE